MLRIAAATSVVERLPLDPIASRVAVEIFSDVAIKRTSCSAADLPTVRADLLSSVLHGCIAQPNGALIRMKSMGATSAPMEHGNDR